MVPCNRKYSINISYCNTCIKVIVNAQASLGFKLVTFPKFGDSQKITFSEKKTYVI
jgi:hypothetical protein